MPSKNKSVSKKSKNLTLWGEDRHFCVRAVAIGLKLFVDTHYPAYHIYRESDLKGVPEYKRRCSKTRITLSMVVRNESKRYLQRMLESAREYIDSAVIIDDASTDNTPDLCQEILKGIPIKIIRNAVSSFSQEHLLRKQQWEETIKMHPDWILSLDADEIFEDAAKTEIRKLVSDPTADTWCFRLYDFWDENRYRSDKYWCAHQSYRPFLIRYNPDTPIFWNTNLQHCGRFPSMKLFHKRLSDLRLRHYGWAKEEDRKAKYQRYLELDPDAKYGWKEQYESILAPSPSLIPWRPWRSDVI